jgi:hypothetical protein
MRTRQGDKRGVEGAVRWGQVLAQARPWLFAEFSLWWGWAWSCVWVWETAEEQCAAMAVSVGQRKENATCEKELKLCRQDLRSENIDRVVGRSPTATVSIQAISSVWFSNEN